MAQDKAFEQRYKAIGKKRTIARQEARKAKWTYNVMRYGRGSQICDECGGYMSWCSICQVWSRSCCVDYGTCQCS